MVGIVLAAETDRRSYCHVHVTGSRDDRLSALRANQPVQVVCKNRKDQLIGKRTDSGAKGSHFAVLGRSALRENEKVPVAIHKISREAETLQKTGLPRKRKNVEEAQRKKISQPFHEAFEQAFCACRTAHFRHPLAPHGGRQRVPNPRGQAR